MAVRNRVGIVCPRCHNIMVYQMEAEISGAQKTLRRYYRCPVCGFRINDMSALSHNGDGRIRIVVKWLREWNGSKRYMLAVLRNGNIRYI